jgi:type I restriction enzyme S subunit
MVKLRQELFKNFVTLQRGFDLPASRRVEGEYPVVAATSINGYHNEYKNEPPGVVTGRSGALGEVQYIDTKFWALNTTLWVRDFKGNHPKYVYYFLKTLDLKRFNSGAGVPTLNRNDLDTLEIRIHDYSAQCKIADILSTYDRLIENNTRRIKILEEMSQLLYQEWFVNFRFPGHEQVSMVESELGLIPQDWEVGKLEDALLLQRGFDLPTKQRKEGSVPVYAATGITGTHNEAKVKAPGVVTGRSGSLGTVMYVHEDFWALNTTLWVREFRRVTPIYAFYLLSSLGLEQFNSGAAVPTLNRNDVHGLLIIIPPSPVIDKFDGYVQAWFDLKNNLLAKNDNLRETRDLLLPKLISGEIDVDEIDTSDLEAIAA